MCKDRGVWGQELQEKRGGWGGRWQSDQNAAQADFCPTAGSTPHIHCESVPFLSGLLDLDLLERGVRSRFLTVMSR